MAQVSVTTYAECPFSATVELAEKVVGQRKGMYVSPSPPFGERVHFAAASTDDSSDDARKHDALLIAWRPQSRLFPEFRGVLTVRPERHGSRLRLHGDYAPPYGMAGKAFDLVLGRTLARRTMHHFLNELRAEIEAAYHDEVNQRV
jgi:hypothetical protein